MVSHCCWHYWQKFGCLQNCLVILIYEELEIIMVDYFVGFQICLENGEKPTAIINYESCYIYCNHVYVYMHMHTHTYTCMNTCLPECTQIRTDTQTDEQTCDIAASMTVNACRIQCLPTWPSVMSTLISSSGTSAITM